MGDPATIMVIDEDFEAARALVNSAEEADDETETVDALLDGRVLLRQPKRYALRSTRSLAASIEASRRAVLDVALASRRRWFKVALRVR